MTAQISSVLVIVAWMASAATSAAAADRERADYLAGYAAAVVERDLGLDVLQVRVEGAEVVVTVRGLGGVSPQQITEALVRIEGIERAQVNLSYEGVDLLVSADLHPTLRLYIGGGAIVRSEPDLDPFSAQAGVELQSPVAFFGGTVRPIAAGDFQFREESDWEEDISGAAGLQLENPQISPLRVQILFQYFRGNSPNGQFFVRRIEYMGVGVHLHF